MIKGMRHSGIVVRDLDESVHFYRDLLGFKIVKKADEPGEYIDALCGLSGAKLVTVKMQAVDGQMIELLEYRSQRGEEFRKKLNDIGLSHIALTVDDLDSEYRRLKESGVAFNSLPRVSPDNYAKVVFCVAPEGTYIELVEVL